MKEINFSVALIVLTAGYLLYGSESSSFKGLPAFYCAVIGGGAAGISMVAQLLEQGIPGSRILWVDQEFRVGRLGKYYNYVPSNQKADRYTAFLEGFDLFKTMHFDSFEKVKKYDQNQEPYMQLIVDPLQDITDYLRKYVVSLKDIVNSLELDENSWLIRTNDKKIRAQKAVLAIGSHPKKLFHEGFEEIPLDLALNEKIIRKMVHPQDKVIVVGSAHSAMLILKYLSEIPVEQAINFYLKEPHYKFGGLEGIAAYWTKGILERNKASNVVRMKYSLQALKQFKNRSYKIIYAIGFEPNPILINGSTAITFDKKTGMIHSNLYGIGIAFPEDYLTEDDRIVPLIGLNAFRQRAKRVAKKFALELKD